MILLQVHVLPQEMLGWSTFGLSMLLLKWFPLCLVDWFLLLISRLVLGDTDQFGLIRPELGPLQLKSTSGKTPVLDVGTLAKIKSGDIKVTIVFFFLFFQSNNLVVYMHVFFLNHCMFLLHRFARP